MQTSHHRVPGRQQVIGTWGPSFLLDKGQKYKSESQIDSAWN